MRDRLLGVSVLLFVAAVAAGYDIFGLVDDIFYHVRLGVGIAAVLILRAAECQNQPEHERQQQKADAKACAQIERLGQVNHHLDGKINVIEGDQQQEKFPAVAIQLLTEDVGIVNGDDAFLALTAHLFIDHPRARHGQDCGNNLNHDTFSFMCFGSLCGEAYAASIVY